MMQWRHSPADGTDVMVVLGVLIGGMVIAMYLRSSRWVKPYSCPHE
jgi:hypothetical protein